MTLLLAALAFALVMTSTSLRQITIDVTESTEGRRVAHSLQSELLVYNRLSNLAFVDPTEDVARARVHSEDRLLSLLAELRWYVDTQREADAVAVATNAVRSYLRERDLLDVREDDLREIVVAIAPVLEEAVGEVEALRDFHHRQVVAAVDRSRRWNRMANSLGAFAALAAALGGLAVLTAGRYYAQPLHTIAERLRRFRPDQPVPAAPEDAPQEVSEIAASFNQMAELLKDQRKAQLEFVAGVAHDLRNPLNYLKLAVQQLAATPGKVPPQVTSSLKRFDRQINRLTRMVADLVEAASVESGQLVLNLKEVDVREVASESVERHTSDSALHALRLAVPEAPVWVTADQERIEQVLDNLITNAIKYSPDGGPVEVAVAEEGDEAVLRVRDRGIGISREDQELVFETFRRVKSDRRVPGLGLGLSVSRRIVEAHGGRMAIDSELGEGTTVSVYLPPKRRT